MQKRAFFIAIITISILGVGAWYVVQAAKPVPVPSTPSTSPKTPFAASSPLQSSSTQASPGAYVAYTDESQVTSTKGIKIIFFHAPWCSQCRALDKDILSSTLPDNVTIFKTDYDSSFDLRKRYGVTLQSTLVKIDSSGNMIKKYVAYSEPTFAELKKNLID